VTKQYNASEARAHFADILDCVAQGEEVEITKHGTPVATITRPKKSRKRKIPPPGWGLKEGWEVKIADDFDAIPEGFEDYV